MYRQVGDFLKAHESSTGRTGKVFAALDDEVLHKPVVSGSRTLAQVAWHIVTTIPEMMARTGLGLSAVDAHSMPPASAQAIQDAYHKTSQEVRDTIARNWTDATLLEVDDMYGETWPRGVTLSVLLAHEAHHVGQLTVLLRAAGRQVPGIMGPSREEWSRYGMEPPAY